MTLCDPGIEDSKYLPLTQIRGFIPLQTNFADYCQYDDLILQIT